MKREGDRKSLPGSDTAFELNGELLAARALAARESRIIWGAAIVEADLKVEESIIGPLNR